VPYGIGAKFGHPDQPVIVSEGVRAENLVRIMRSGDIRLLIRCMIVPTTG
jgi:hypothetical protein